MGQGVELRAFGACKNPFVTVLIGSVTVTPVISNTPATSNSWWVVPVLAGSFVIVGALIAFFSTRASDSRKAKRDREQRIMIETRESGLEFMHAVSAIVSLVKLQRTKSGRKPVEVYLAKLSDAMTDLEEKWHHFELHAAEDALESGRMLLKATLALMIPAQDAEGTSRDFGTVSRSRHDFVNVLRKASGVKEIHKNIPDPIARNKFVEENSEALARIYERLKGF